MTYQEEAEQKTSILKVTRQGQHGLETAVYSQARIGPGWSLISTIALFIVIKRTKITKIGYD